MNAARAGARAVVVSTFAALPPTKVTTEEIEARIGLEPGWILRRTGIRTRYRAQPGELVSELGPQAGRGALERAGIAGEEVCLASASERAVEMAGATLDDIDLFVPHQANARITRAVGDVLALPPERVVDCIEHYGNTTAGTLPIAPAHAHDDGRLTPGTRVLLAAFGAGLTWGGDGGHLGATG